jgi:hypothetical protein
MKLLPLLGDIDLRVVRLDKTHAADDDTRPSAP